MRLVCDVVRNQNSLHMLYGFVKELNNIGKERLSIVCFGPRR